MGVMAWALMRRIAVGTSGPQRLEINVAALSIVRTKGGSPISAMNEALIPTIMPVLSETFEKAAISAKRPCLFLARTCQRGTRRT